MFGKLASTPSRQPSTPVTLEATSAFLSKVVEEGYRLSYAALTVSARILGEDTSGNIPAQRGAKLVKSLPLSLQPYVCRKSGKYGKGVLAQFENVPANLMDRGVITAEAVAEAVKIWEAAN